MNFLMGCLLALLPSFLTGRIGPKAAKEINQWRRSNQTLKRFRISSIRRVLLWASEHPVLFILIGCIGYCAAFYILSISHPVLLDAIRKPLESTSFNLSDYLTTPISVQATLVALVYPIVVSFVAMALQRKANSTVSMRVYILDSGVIPASLSTLALLVFLSSQYFLGFYLTDIDPPFLLPLVLTADAFWFIGNLILTGYFLSQTLKHIQEESQQDAYIRLAVDIALRADICAAVERHVFANASRNEWGLMSHTPYSADSPQIFTFPILTEGLRIERKFSRERTLYDVFLLPLKLASKSWKRRAVNKGQHKARLCFPAQIGAVVSGSVTLCVIEDGPSLNFIEKVLVKCSFWYIPTRTQRLALTTIEMLNELASGVTAAIEKHRFDEAEVELNRLTKLHISLLQASVANIDGQVGNAATIASSASAWSHSSFGADWSSTYRNLLQLSVDCLPDDPRLFRQLSFLPAKLAGALPPRPEELDIDILKIGAALAYDLGEWRKRKLDATGNLPVSLQRPYEQGFITFIGHWGHFRVRVPEKNLAIADDEAWALYAARSRIYGKHIEETARILLNAIARNDEVAAVRLYESFIKWWESRAFELQYGHIPDFESRNISLSINALSWANARELLWGTEGPPSIDFGRRVLNKAIKRFWEAMRLYLTLTLISRSLERKTLGDIEVRFTSYLIEGKALHGGYDDIDCLPYSPTNIFELVLRLVFSQTSPVEQLDAFSERMSSAIDEDMVSGWTYGGSSSDWSLESMHFALGVLLNATVQSSRPPALGDAPIFSWWSALERLERAKSYAVTLHGNITSLDFQSVCEPTITELKAHIKNPVKTSTSFGLIETSLKRFVQTTENEYQSTLRILDISPSVVLSLSSLVGEKSFVIADYPLPIRSIQFKHDALGTKASLSFNVSKSILIEGYSHASSLDSISSSIAPHIEDSIIASALENLLSGATWKPIDSSKLATIYTSTLQDAQEFVQSVATECHRLENQGQEPVVICGGHALSSFLSPSQWGIENHQFVSPADVSLTQERVGLFGGGPSFINGTQIFNLGNRLSGCYVVPAAIFSTLSVEGSSPSSAVQLSWRLTSDTNVALNVSWKAAFNG